jgi:hypothetical protein
MIFCGFAITISGLFPGLIAIFPSGRLIPSRVFTLPAAGVSILMGIIIWKLSEWISGSTHNRNKAISFTFILFLLPFILFGAWITRSIGDNYQTAWNNQKGIWDQFIGMVPDISPDTFVVLLMPDYHNMFDVPPLQAGNDSFEYALTALNGYHRITGAFCEADLSDLIYADDAIILKTDNQQLLMPYEQLLLFKYDKDMNILQRIASIPAGVSKNHPNGIALCKNCILAIPAEKPPLRWLIQ